ncbi:MAG: peptidoglycan-binding domain-containing protein [Candidatus Omnitrophota bacterium]|nr:peptidoglycan-binding domain-containing protein [Candidatus Omnitrophota bacterium]MDZ4241425.1 peptidoglycan-binding domain-containing protein [Candidatus Omnitrophota bacterium]
MKKSIVVTGVVLGGIMLAGCGGQQSKEDSFLEDMEIVLEENATTGSNEAVLNEVTMIDPTQPVDPAAVASANPETALEITVAKHQEIMNQSRAFEKPGAQDIQQSLKNAGFYDGSVDGVIGPLTRRAIREFQEQNSLTADGKVGPKTWEKLAPYLTANQQAAVTRGVTN